MVEINDLWLTYPGAAHPSVHGVSLHIAAGEFLTLLGPSGCGKTTTLRSVAGLETPTAGSIAIGDQRVFDSSKKLNIPTHSRDIAMVFQSYAIWPHMTVGQNVAFPLEVQKLSRDVIVKRVTEALTMVGMESMADRSATRLSGGQQQRVAIARALVRRATVMLLDEPLSNLDAKLREQMRVELRDLLKRVGMTAIYVTHDQEEALMLSDRIAVMQAGRLAEVGTPRSLYLSPSTVFGATFLGAAEIFPVIKSDGLTVDADIGPLELDGTIEGIGFVAIRPEAIEVHQSGEPQRANCFAGQLESVVFAGKQQHLVIRLASGRQVNAIADVMRTYQVGALVQVELPRSRLMVLQKEDA